MGERVVVAQRDERAARAPSFLVINVTRIGDTLLATPAIRAIAKTYPGSRITVLAHPKRAEVLRHLPFVREVATLTKRRILWRRLVSAERFDYALVYGFDAPLVRYALDTAERVVAFRQPDERLNKRLYRVVEPPPYQSVHAVMHALRLTDALHLRPDGYRLSYQVLPEEQDWAQARLQKVLGANTKPLIGLQLASFHTKAYRDWPLERFVALARRIVEHYHDAHFVLFGGSTDREKTQAFAAELPGRASVFAGKLTLRESAAIMSLLDLYIGVDTGPTHLMGTMDRPMVVLYHAHSPSRLLAPLGHPCLEVVDHPLAGTDAGTSVPMSDISVDSVWHKVQAALRPRADAGTQLADADVPTEHSAH